MKRKLISKSYLLLALTGVLGFSSCLKDSRYTDFSKVGTLVEFPLAANAGQFQSQSFDIKPDPLTFQVAVNVASPVELTKALPVTVSVDQATLDAYNTANGETYTLLPAADFSIPASVTVPANQRIGLLTITIKSNLIDPAGHFAIPLKITDASGEKISNYNTIIYAVSVKNQYDGIYKATGTFVRVGLDQRTINQSKSVSTINANTVQSTVADLGTALNLTVNADNSVTVAFVGSSLSGLPGAYSSDGVNTYNPSTKTFTLHYQYRSGARTTEETLVYIGPR